MKRPFQSYILLIDKKNIRELKWSQLLKKLLNVKHTVIEDFNIVIKDEGTDILEVNIRPYKSFQNVVLFVVKSVLYSTKIQHDVLGELLILQVLLLRTLVILVG